MPGMSKYKYTSWAKLDGRKSHTDRDLICLRYINPQNPRVNYFSNVGVEFPFLPQNQMCSTYLNIFNNMIIFSGAKKFSRFFSKWKRERERDWRQELLTVQRWSTYLAYQKSLNLIHGISLYNLKRTFSNVLEWSFLNWFP